MIDRAWFAHSSGGEQAIIDALPRFKQMGGRTLGLLDFADDQYMRRPALTALWKACISNGLTCIPGAVSAGHQLSLDDRWNPQPWMVHVREALWWKRYRGATVYAIDPEKEWGMDALDSADGRATTEQVWAIAANIRWLGTAMRENGVTLVLAGAPAERRGLNPRARLLADLMWPNWPDGTLLLDQRSTENVPHPLGDARVVWGWTHSPICVFGEYLRQATSLGVADHSAFYCPVGDIGAQLVASPVTRADQATPEESHVTAGAAATSIKNQASMPMP